MGSKVVYSYFLVWILWEVKIILNTVPDPCPDIQPSSQVTDMCQSGSAMEQIGEAKDGNDNFDHVTLRSRQQEDNCICIVFIENQSLENIQMYIEPYRKLESSAPKEPECGMELYVDFYQIENIQQHTPPAFKCTSGQTTSSLTFFKHSVLRFTSTLIGGTFTRGYCIDFKRVHVPGHNATLKIVCDIPGRTPSMQMTTEPSDDLTGNPSTTSSIDMIELRDDTTVYIVVGGCAGGLFIVIAILVIVFCKRKSADKTVQTQEASKPDTTPTNEHDDPDYNGLKYNMLYLSAEYQDTFEGDYHTVDNDQPPINKKVSEHDMHYSTVDDNVTRTSLNTVPTYGVVKNSHKGLGYDNTKDTENTKVKHHIPSIQNSNVYAVVDKKKRVVVDDKNGTVDPSQTYAIVDKTRKN